MLIRFLIWRTKYTDMVAAVLKWWKYEDAVQSLLSRAIMCSADSQTISCARLLSPVHLERSRQENWKIPNQHMPPYFFRKEVRFIVFLSFFFCLNYMEHHYHRTPFSWCFGGCKLVSETVNTEEVQLFISCNNITILNSILQRCHLKIR